MRRAGELFGVAAHQLLPAKKSVFDRLKEGGIDVEQLSTSQVSVGRAERRGHSHGGAAQQPATKQHMVHTHVEQHTKLNHTTQHGHTHDDNVSAQAAEASPASPSSFSSSLSPIQQVPPEQLLSLNHTTQHEPTRDGDISAQVIEASPASPLSSFPSFPPIQTSVPLPTADDRYPSAQHVSHTISHASGASQRRHAPSKTRAVSKRAMQADKQTPSATRSATQIHQQSGQRTSATPPTQHINVATSAVRHPAQTSAPSQPRVQLDRPAAGRNTVRHTAPVITAHTTSLTNMQPRHVKQHHPDSKTHLPSQAPVSTSTAPPDTAAVAEDLFIVPRIQRRSSMRASAHTAPSNTAAGGEADSGTRCASPVEQDRPTDALSSVTPRTSATAITLTSSQSVAPLQPTDHRTRTPLDIEHAEVTAAWHQPASSAAPPGAPCKAAASSHLALQAAKQRIELLSQHEKLLASVFPAPKKPITYMEVTHANPRTHAHLLSSTTLPLSPTPLVYSLSYLSTLSADQRLRTFHQQHDIHGIPLTHEDMQMEEDIEGALSECADQEIQDEVDGGHEQHGYELVDAMVELRPYQGGMFQTTDEAPTSATSSASSLLPHQLPSPAHSHMASRSTLHSHLTSSRPLLHSASVASISTVHTLSSIASSSTTLRHTDEYLTVDQYNTNITLGIIQYKHMCTQLGVAPLSKLLSLTSSITTLNLSHYGLNEEQMTSLATLLQYNTTLTSVNLASNLAGSAGMMALGSALQANRTLTTLNLSYCWPCLSPDAPAMSHFSQALATNTTLTCLDLSHNKFSLEAVTILLPALTRNTGLSTLHLSHCSLSDSCAASVSKVLEENTHLTCLDLTHNSFFDQAGVLIANALAHNTTLRTLKLSHNGLSHKSGLAFATALSSPAFPLHHLYLDHNHIQGSKVWKQLLDATVKRQIVQILRGEMSGEESGTKPDDAMALANNSAREENISRQMGIGGQGKTEHATPSPVSSSTASLHVDFSGNHVTPKESLLFMHAQQLLSSLYDSLPTIHEQRQRQKYWLANPNLTTSIPSPKSYRTRILHDRRASTNKAKDNPLPSANLTLPHTARAATSRGGTTTNHPAAKQSGKAALASARKAHTNSNSNSNAAPANTSLTHAHPAHPRPPPLPPLQPSTSDDSTADDPAAVFQLADDASFYQHMADLWVKGHMKTWPFTPRNQRQQPRSGQHMQAQTIPTEQDEKHHTHLDHFTTPPDHSHSYSSRGPSSADPSYAHSPASPSPAPYDCQQNESNSPSVADTLPPPQSFPLPPAAAVAQPSHPPMVFKPRPKLALYYDGLPTLLAQVNQHHELTQAQQHIERAERQFVADEQEKHERERDAKERAEHEEEHLSKLVAGDFFQPHLSAHHTIPEADKHYHHRKRSLNVSLEQVKYHSRKNSEQLKQEAGRADAEIMPVRMAKQTKKHATRQLTSLSANDPDATPPSSIVDRHADHSATGKAIPFTHDSHAGERRAARSRKVKFVTTHRTRGHTEKKQAPNAVRESMKRNGHVRSDAGAMPRQSGKKAPPLHPAPSPSAHATKAATSPTASPIMHEHTVANQSDEGHSPPSRPSLAAEFEEEIPISQWHEKGESDEKHAMDHHASTSTTRTHRSHRRDPSIARAIQDDLDAIRLKQLRRANKNHTAAQQPTQRVQRHTTHTHMAEAHSPSQELFRNESSSSARHHWSEIEEDECLIDVCVSCVEACEQPHQQRRATDDDECGEPCEVEEELGCADECMGESMHATDQPPAHLSSMPSHSTSLPSAHTSTRTPADRTPRNPPLAISHSHTDHLDAPSHTLNTSTATATAPPASSHAAASARVISVSGRRALDVGAPVDVDLLERGGRSVDTRLIKQVLHQVNAAMPPHMQLQRRQLTQFGLSDIHSTHVTTSAHKSAAPRGNLTMLNTHSKISGRRTGRR